MTQMARARRISDALWHAWRRLEQRATADGNRDFTPPEQAEYDLLTAAWRHWKDRDHALSRQWLDRYWAQARERRRREIQAAQPQLELFTVHGSPLTAHTPREPRP